MAKISIKKLLVLSVISGLIAPLCSSLTVFAIDANDGDGSAGGGGGATCAQFLYTGSCGGGGGAAWGFSTMDDIAAGKVNGVHLNDDGSITIDGFGGTNGFRASGATITCPAGAGGIWHYGMVATRSDYGYSAGDIVGLIGLDGNSSSYTSEMLGGGLSYNGNNYNQVRQEYMDLYNQGLVHEGWGNGSGLSWFCSNGNGGYTPPAVSEPCTGGPSVGYTTIDTKVINPRLTGVGSGWKNYNPNGQVTYAMPTDEIQWAHCYYPGVQLNYNKLDTSLGETYVNGSRQTTIDPDGFHNSHYENFRDNYGRVGSAPGDHSWGYDGSGWSTMRAQMNRLGLSWENWFEISRNVTPWKPDSQTRFEFANGYGNKYSRREYSQTTTGNVGSILAEDSWTSEPTRFTLEGVGDETWGCKNVRYETYDYDHTEGPFHGYNTWFIYPGWPSWCNGQYIDPAGIYTCRERYEYYNDIYMWKEHYKTICNRHGSGYTRGRLDTWRKYSGARVIVPYNYINEPQLSFGDNSTSYVFAGSTVNVGTAGVRVWPKGNSYTEATYATIVRNAKIRLVEYVSTNGAGASYISGSGDNLCQSIASVQGMCEQVGSYDGTLNSGGDLQGVFENIGSVAGEYNVFDAAAGDKLCFQLAVYPSNSGADDNTNPNGNGAWTLSAPICKTIAKSPSFEVLGGSVYSAVEMSALSMHKTNLFGSDVLPFKPYSSQGGHIYFGSGVEQSLYGLKKIDDVASGNAYLKTGINNNGMCVEYRFSMSGASGEFSVKNMAPLTFANYGNNICIKSSSQEKEYVGNMNEQVASVDRAELVDYWTKKDWTAKTAAGEDGLGAYDVIVSRSDKDIFATTDASNAEHATNAISDTIFIPSDTTRIVKINGDFVINHNIVYSGMNQRITNPGDISKVIIYAKNIKISCSVTEVDAILITSGASGADGTIDTCYEAAGKPVDDARRARKLSVFGTVITDRMTLGRTYGASVGDWSSESAETFNYDSSILLWARYMAGAGESNTLTVTYQNELAPRY